MILIVDDDPSVVAALGLLLKRHGHPTGGARSQEEALALLRGQEFDLVLQDMNFSRGTAGEEGLALLGEIRRLRPRLPVILITAWGSISLAVEGMKAGAADFVTKPWSNAQILQSVETALSLAAQSGDGRSAAVSREELDRRMDLRGLIGDEARFLKILGMIGRVAPDGASVLHH